MDERSMTPVIEDERLELMFTCCHPALATEAQVALTLRALGGLSTEQIARAFLVSEETMKRRLSRAKLKIPRGRDPVRGARRPPPARPSGGGPGGHLPDLQRGLQRPGRSRGRGHPPRRRARLADADEPEVRGLLAPMRSTILGARLGSTGDDRAAREAGPIAVGPNTSSPPVEELLDQAIALRGRGPYLLQAAIASLQSDESIDWPEVVELYGRLAEITSSPVVELNRAVALARRGQPRRRSGSSTGSSSPTTPICTRRGASYFGV